VKNAKWIGKVCLQLDKTSSTNDDARRWAVESPPPEGAVVRADEQTAGRGQMGNRWFSEPGQNLTFSVILYPKWLPPDQQFKLSMAIALALQGALTELVPDVQVKWPNDILINGVKMGGILIQNTLSGYDIQSSIVGIGLNVNQTNFDALDRVATSLRLQTDQIWDLDALAEHIYAYLESYYTWIQQTPFQDVAALYCQHLYGYGQNLRFQRSDNLTFFDGQIVGIHPNGRLQVRSSDGTLNHYDLKEIAFITE
jgi:BirA family transcriptional regulator, biotin operon repressor / biotin---[acetyl-CoA-carboxylase] ligase